MLTDWAKEEISGWRTDLLKFLMAQAWKYQFNILYLCNIVAKKKNTHEEEFASVPDKNQNMLLEERDNFEK